MIVVPVYEMILAPEATLYLSMEQLRKSAGNKGVSVNEKIVLIVAKEHDEESAMSEGGFYPVGVAATVKEINPQGYAVIRTQYRVNIESLGVNPDGTVHLTISRRPDLEDLEHTVEAAKLKNLKEEMRKYSSGFSWGDSARYIIDQIDTLGMAACAMSPVLHSSNENAMPFWRRTARQSGRI